MSGEGALAGCPMGSLLLMETAGAPMAEMADVIAFLEQRRDNAATIAERWPDFEHEARIQRRLIDTLLTDFRAGMHEGAAGVRARLLSSRETTNAG
jgi:hypothetical protein